MTIAKKTGRPFPSKTRMHGEAFAPGTAFDPVDPAIVATVPIGGDTYTRVYFKASQAGTLKFEFLRPWPSESVYSTKPIDDVVTLADTESVSDIPVEGESRLQITFTPDVAGTVTYCDVGHNSSGI